MHRAPVIIFPKWWLCPGRRLWSDPRAMKPLLLVVTAIGLVASACGVVAADDAKTDLTTLTIGSPFPDFNETDINGKPVSVANYKGKVVLVDFWATWCGPCVAELPNVLKAYQKYHDKGFEILGISLDQDKEKLTGFTKEKNMTWQQYFDGKGWQSKLGAKYGINSMPATFLLDKDGKIIGKDLRGEALEQALANTLK